MVADGDAAKDIVEEVFIKLFENHGKLDGGTPTKVWLFKSARNKCLNYIRDRGKLSNIGDGGDEIPGLTVRESETLDSSEIIVKIFDNLPTDYREVLVMREWSELTYDEIARALDTTVPSVKSKLFKARKKAAEIYERFYGEK